MSVMEFRQEICALKTKLKHLIINIGADFKRLLSRTKAKYNDVISFFHDHMIERNTFLLSSLIKGPQVD